LDIEALTNVPMVTIAMDFKMVAMKVVSNYYLKSALPMSYI